VKNKQEIKIAFTEFVCWTDWAREKFPHNTFTEL
jgi:hypothetical protein